jgi:hypothetical protein
MVQSIPAAHPRGPLPPSRTGTPRSGSATFSLHLEGREMNLDPIYDWFLVGDAKHYQIMIKVGGFSDVPLKGRSKFTNSFSNKMDITPKFRLELCEPQN